MQLRSRGRARGPGFESSGFRYGGLECGIVWAGFSQVEVGLGLLGGSWVVLSRVTSRVTILITHIRGLITLLITTPEPQSKGQERSSQGGPAVVQLRYLILYNPKGLTTI